MTKLNWGVLISGLIVVLMAAGMMTGAVWTIFQDKFSSAAMRDERLQKEINDRLTIDTFKQFEKRVIEHLDRLDRKVSPP